MNHPWVERADFHFKTPLGLTYLDFTTQPEAATFTFTFIN